MREIEILRKIADSAIKMRKYKDKYDSIMLEHTRSFPFADSRHSKVNIANRAKKISPIYEKYKEHKRQFEGWVTAYDCKFMKTKQEEV